MAGVTFEAVSKRFGETRAVEGVSLAIADGEFFALLGPSGCGKTTLLRLVAGFEIPDEGSVTLGVAVFFLHYEGNSPAAAAVAVISIAVTLMLAVLTSLMARNLPEGVVPWRA